MRQVVCPCSMATQELMGQKERHSRSSKQNDSPKYCHKFQPTAKARTVKLCCLAPERGASPQYPAENRRLQTQFLSPGRRRLDPMKGVAPDRFQIARPLLESKAARRTGAKILSDFLGLRRYTDKDDDQFGIAPTIHATCLRGSFCGSGGAAFGPGLLGGVAPGPLSPTGRRGGSIRLHGLVAQCP